MNYKAKYYFYEFEWIGRCCAKDDEHAIEIMLSTYPNDCNIEMLKVSTIIKIPIFIEGDIRWSNDKWLAHYKKNMNTFKLDENGNKI
jgi:hypothetical protein